MLRSFRGTEAADPATFITAIVTVLVKYPIDIARAAADPYSGIPGKQNWVPTPYEVRKFCDDIYLPRLRAAEREKRVQEQLAERDQIESQGGLKRQTYEEAKAEMAQCGIFFDQAGRPKRLETEKTVRERLGITKEQWDAIPNAPPRIERD